MIARSVAGSYITRQRTIPAQRRATLPVGGDIGHRALGRDKWQANLWIRDHASVTRNTIGVGWELSKTGPTARQHVAALPGAVCGPLGCQIRGSSTIP